ncbi:hypothetical protein [Pseudomonas sp. BN411]|uniref:hypothetical protein n=1 Tax=Pseudomonas sp. BN411 TaxID=2567887 RepID=UPI002457D34D|nr:hypothetical protein [Pseudomonas sp. BN411]MDH4560030.1 hypothetical protein [Pseudomonas sp. BN411]
MELREPRILPEPLEQRQVLPILSSIVDAVMMRFLPMDEAIDSRVPDRKGFRIHKVKQRGRTNHRTIYQLGKLPDLILNTPRVPGDGFPVIDRNACSG